MTFLSLCSEFPNLKSTHWNIFDHLLHYSSYVYYKVAPLSTCFTANILIHHKHRCLRLRIMLAHELSIRFCYCKKSCCFIKLTTVLYENTLKTLTTNISFKSCMLNQSMYYRNVHFSMSRMKTYPFCRSTACLE